LAAPPSPESQPPTDGTRQQGPSEGAQLDKLDEGARLFYESLEQSGQLVDVETGDDLIALPPSVTHVRYPDGTVERVGFSASPYGS
jgi:hypothetical protein